MIDIKELIKNYDKFSKLLSYKNFDILKLKKLIDIKNKINYSIYEIEQLQHLIKKFSKKPPSKNKIKELTNTKNNIKILKDNLVKLNNLFYQIYYLIPNVPRETIPKGQTKSKNKIIKIVGKIKLSEKIISHEILGEKKDIFSKELGTKITGAKFMVYKGKGLLLKRALENFLIDLHVTNNYIPFHLPVIINKTSLFNSGQLPKFQDDLYQLKIDNFYLSPTSEVQFLNIFSNKIINVEKPIKYCGLTECFRLEAGAGGKINHGLMRLHQFSKIELFWFTNQLNEEKYFKELVDDVIKILDLLKIPYRVVELCGGELGFSAAKSYDIEGWLPSQNKYIELSSVSLCTDFQARRAKIKDKDKKFVYTYNASGMAIDRLIAVIIENYQDINNDILIPQILKKFLNFNII